MARSKKPDINPYPVWAPRFWHSMLFTDLQRLLGSHAYRVHPTRWGIAIGATFTSVFNSKMRLIQLALHGHEVQKTQLVDDPIFILGHWRSGTTYLHELLSLDQRFSSPTTYQCFAANHFLITEFIITKLFWFLIPSRRPMDNMQAGWHAPQEDEFALCAMGLPSPYLRMAFPNHTTDENLEYLDMNLCQEDLDEWKKGLATFLQALSKHIPKRLVLKSPTHTGRVRMLAEMFPNAKFIHIARNPYDVVPSTIRLWQSLEYVQALQDPDFDHVPEYVFRAYRRMYDGYFPGREHLDPERLLEVNYESLVADPMSTMEEIYERFQLEGFGEVRPLLEENLEERKDYKKNKHVLDEDLVAQINEHWQDYFTAFGYEMQ